MPSPIPRIDTSDPVSYTCTCPAQTEGGTILLFYRYWSNNPKLPEKHLSKSQDPHSLAAFHKDLTTSLHLGGKFRLATEGFNITLGGTNPAIEKYISACTSHWSFSGLALSSKKSRDAYFKPTPGCACAFANRASIKVTAEITPLGLTNYVPKTWSKVISLSPPDFHALCARGDVPLIDVRNHYESRIGYFVRGEEAAVAVRPAVRRFSQWPGYVVRHVLGKEVYQRAGGVATYCTGGIRCEKGARFLQECLAGDGGGGEEAPVYTLMGGIVAYQAWMEGEVRAGRKEPGESFFKGSNYVFDGRGKIGGLEAVSQCHGCGEREARLGKCVVEGCHLVLVVCERCEGTGGVACCGDCREVHEGDGTKSRRMCSCESEREKSLWGDGGARLGRSGARPKTKSAATR